MLPLSISARGSSSCRLLGKLWPLPRIRREASTWTPSSFDPRDKSAPTTLTFTLNPFRGAEISTFVITSFSSQNLC